MAEKELFENLRREVARRQAAGELPVRPTQEQRIDWAFGNAAIENEQVTREVARDAVTRRPSTPWLRERPWRPGKVERE